MGVYGLGMRHQHVWFVLVPADGIHVVLWNELSRFSAYMTEFCGFVAFIVVIFEAICFLVIFERSFFYVKTFEIGISTSQLDLIFRSRHGLDLTGAPSVPRLARPQLVCSMAGSLFVGLMCFKTHRQRRYLDQAVVLREQLWLKYNFPFSCFKHLTSLTVSQLSQYFIMDFELFVY